MVLFFGELSGRKEHMGDGDTEVTPGIKSIHWQEPGGQRAVTIGNEPNIKAVVVRCESNFFGILEHNDLELN